MNCIDVEVLCPYIGPDFGFDAVKIRLELIADGINRNLLGFDLIHPTNFPLGRISVSYADNAHFQR